MTPEYGERTEKINKLLDAGMDARAIAKKVDCSESYVNRVARSHGVKNVKLEEPGIPLDLPDIDPTKPGGPQYEALAVALLRDAARNGSRTQKIQASKELIRLAQRQKEPPPVSRKLRFVIETIDVLDDDKIHVIERQPIKVKL